MTLIVSRNTNQVFCRISFHWNVSDVFLVIRLRLRVWGRTTTEVKCHSHHIISEIYLPTWIITDDLDLSLLMLIIVCQDSPPQIYLSPRSILYSLERRHYVEPILKEWGIMFPLLEGRVSIDIIRNNSVCRIGFFSLFCLFIQSFIYMNS